LAGRLCLVDFPGAEPSPSLERLIVETHIGGVVLFRKNVTSPTRVAELTAELQAIARTAGMSGLWVAIDHEGGVVNRFLPGSGLPRVTPLPSAMAIGATGDPALAHEAGRVAGRELRAMGIHLNFAPVLDVNNNPANPVIGARAFGESPALVEAMGLAYIKGLEDAGVAATAKHFPGHGDVSVDSHLALPRVAHGAARLEAVELFPFAAAARAGVAAMMTAHIVFPALDPSGAPATMSAPVLNGILRERWGYRGLLLTDSLSMRAIVDHYGAGEAAVAAIRAGCDMVLALGPDALQQEILDHLAGAIERGEISGARIAETLARIDAAAGRWGVRPAGEGPGSKVADLAGAVGTADHDRTAGRIAESAVTLVRNRAGLIPLTCARPARIGVASLSPGYEGQGPPDLASPLRRHRAEPREVAAGDALTDLECVIAVTSTRGTPDPRQVANVRSLHRQAGDRLVVVASGDPYDLLEFPEVPAYLAIYGSDEPSLDAAARVLLGLWRAQGRLPVSLPGLYPMGHGLTGAAS
jgi:beta-N-acetylhexosaminidase